MLAADEADRTSLNEFGALASGVETSTGTELPDPADFDLVVPSPGIPAARYTQRARAVAGDIELAGEFLEIPIIAVTGTNGKSTTVLLIEAMLRNAGLRARAAGNVGTPALSLVGEPLDVAVLEVSSFQLESIDRFRPRVATVLNISPDHLDRHGDFEHYLCAKQRIFENQEASDTAVLNFDDAEVRSFASTCRARVSGFSRRRPVDEGVFLDSGAVVVRTGEQTQRIPLDGLHLAGVHNLENVLAAVATITALGVDPARAIGALHGFSGLPHRCETVATVADVTYVNDSKATNPGAAQRSLEGFESPLVWIAGGRDKGLDFENLADTAVTRAKSALLYGEAAPLLDRAIAGRIDTRRVENLDQAVTLAAELAQAGDVVLLAPACASFDQFGSFEDRGEHFCGAVRALQREAVD